MRAALLASLDAREAAGKTKEDVQGIELRSQRNWIPKNPIWIERTIGNCYENSKVVIESIENDLQSKLNKQMRPELYGQAVNKIILKCSFSYYDHVCCKCNYVIADEKLKLRQKELYPKIVGLSTALENLRKKQMDATAIKKMFGEEGYNVASVLINEADKVEYYTKAITGNPASI